MSRIFLKCVFGLVAVILLSNGAMAATITSEPQNTQIGYISPGDNFNTLSVIKFDSNLGTLTAVNISVTLDFNQTLTWTTTTSYTGSSAPYYATFGNIAIKNVTGTYLFSSANYSTPTIYSGTPPSTWADPYPRQNVNKNNSPVIVPLNFEPQNFSLSLTNINSTEFANFSGAGSYNFLFSFSSDFDYQSKNNLSASANPLGNGQISVRYVYEERPVVPIPASVWMLGSGLVGFVALKRRRK